MTNLTTAWDYLLDSQVITAGEMLLIDKTAGFFYILFLFITVLIIYVSTRSTGAVFMTSMIGSVLLIYYNKIPANFHYIIYIMMVFSFTFYLYKMFWNK